MLISVNLSASPDSPRTIGSVLKDSEAWRARCQPVLDNVVRTSTIAYLVFHHNLLITNLHNIHNKIILIQMAYMDTKVGFMASR